MTVPQSSGVLEEKVKPRLRGISHALAFLGAVGGSVLLATASAQPVLHRAALLYGAGLMALFGISGLYHAPMWGSGARRVLRRLDHASIFLLIAGSYTPMAVLDARGAWSANLTFMWSAAALGIVFVVAWTHAPRVLRSGIYLALGSLAAPVILRLPAVIGSGRARLLLVGALIYALGAVVYARRWPNPSPTLFGYHEVFHLMVIAAAAMQYIALLDALRAF